MGIYEYAVTHGSGAAVAEGACLRSAAMYEAMLWTPRAPAHRQQAASGMNENGGGKRLSAAPANTECTAAGGSTEPESVGRLAAAPPARRLRVYVGWVGGEARTARRLRVFPGKPEAPRAF